jgi:DNA-binding MarR family transcriptional regulator
VYGLLAQFGPAMVTTLAQRTGSDPGRLSYHLRELAKRGFVEPAPELARDGRESWWRLVPGGWSFSTTEIDDPAGLAVAETLYEMTVADEFERLQHYEATHDQWSQEWIAAAETTNSYLRATPAELHELTDAINSLIREWADAAEGRRPDAAAVTQQDGREGVFLFMHAFPVRP